MSCEREATGNSILAKEMSSVSFIVSQPPLPLPLHQIVKIKIGKAWPHESLLPCLRQGPLLGLAALPAVPLPASSLRRPTATAKFRFNFLSGLSLFLGFPHRSLPSSSFTARNVGFPLLQLSDPSHGVALLRGLSPKPGISLFFQHYAGGSIVWKNAEERNTYPWRSSHCWASRGERSVGESLLLTGCGLEWGAAPT